MMPERMLLSEADVRLNLPVRVFTFGTTMFAGVLFGRAPAWHATRLNLNEVLKESGRSIGIGRHILRRSLVVTEFALALSLLAGGGLALHSLWNLAHANLGFPTDHLLTFMLPVPDGQLKGAEQVNSFYRQLLEKIQALPGVKFVSASTGAPPYNAGFGLPFQIAGKPNIEDPSARPNMQFGAITPAYFETYGICLERGRGFTEQDRQGSVPVAVVNETFAKEYFSGVDPLTQRVLVQQLVPGVANNKLGAPVAWQIVGVVCDVPNRGLREEVSPETYVPFAESPWPQAVVAVRSQVEPENFDQERSLSRSIHGSQPSAGFRDDDRLPGTVSEHYCLVVLP